jgi:RNA exonuclease 4
MGKRAREEAVLSSSSSVISAEVLPGARIANNSGSVISSSPTSNWESFKSKAFSKRETQIDDNGRTLPSSDVTAEVGAPSLLVTKPATSTIDAESRRKQAALATLLGPFPPPEVELQGEENRIVALDCEMVGVGTEGRSALALVVMIDWHGRVLFRSFCKPSETVTDFRTFVSGVRADHLIGAPDFRAVQARVCALLTGRVLVGHGLQNDLEALLLHHEISARRDTAHYPPLMRRNPYGVLRSQKLKVLVKEHLGTDIQREGAAHDPAEDARAALALYKSFRLPWERDMAKINARKKHGKTKKQAAAVA